MAQAGQLFQRFLLAWVHIFPLSSSIFLIAMRWIVECKDDYDWNAIVHHVIAIMFAVESIPEYQNSKTVLHRVIYKNGPAFSGLISFFYILFELDAMMSKLANKEEYHGRSLIALSLVIIMVLQSTTILILQVKTYSMKPLLIPMSFIMVLMANFIILDRVKISRKTGIILPCYSWIYPNDLYILAINFFGYLASSKWFVEKCFKRFENPWKISFVSCGLIAIASSVCMMSMAVQGHNFHGCRTTRLNMNYFPMFFFLLAIPQFFLGFFMMAFVCLPNCETEEQSVPKVNKKNNEDDIVILGPNPEGFKDVNNQVTFATFDVINEKRMPIKNV